MMNKNLKELMLLFLKINVSLIILYLFMVFFFHCIDVFVILSTEN